MNKSINWLQDQGYFVVIENDHIKVLPKNQSTLMAIFLMATGLLFSAFTFPLTALVIIGMVVFAYGFALITRRKSSMRLYPDGCLSELGSNSHEVQNNRILVHQYDVSSYTSAVQEGNRDYGCELYFITILGRKKIIMEFHSRVKTGFEEAKEAAEDLSNKLEDIGKGIIHPNI